MIADNQDKEFKHKGSLECTRFFVYILTFLRSIPSLTRRNPENLRPKKGPEESFKGLEIKS